MEKPKNIEWKGKSRGGSLGHLLFILTIKYLGIRAAYCLLAFVVPYFVPFAPKATKAIWCYYRKIHRKGVLKSACLLFIHYYRFGQTIVDKVACNSGYSDRFSYVFDNLDEYEGMLTADQGVVVIGAHIGSWEMGAPFFKGYGKKINVVMYDAEYQKIKEVVSKYSDSRSYSIIALNDDPIENLVKMKQVLDSKELLCFQGDRFMEGSATMKTSFLGHEALFPQGPFIVASRMRVPVIFYFAMRERGMRYRYYFTSAVLENKPVNGKKENELLNQYCSALEQMVRKYPQQWFNFYQFWN